jgi:phosphoribosylformimino-5-aminoimidazole carboxamide ribotide isomerase
MYLLPAIDLRGGKCVRLIQGDYNRQIDYEDDPVKQARSFIVDGARWLHLIDLDGANTGKLVNTDAIAAVMALGSLRVEVGGGIREESNIMQLMEMGVERVIIGTKAIADYDWFAAMTRRFKGRLALGLDARGSKVATHGWTQESPRELLDFARLAATLPIAAIIYTDISRDGMLAGPNLERTAALADAVDVPVIASGGVTTIADILALANTRVAGAIVGRALYEGTISVADALKALADEQKQ